MANSYEQFRTQYTALLTEIDDKYSRDLNATSAINDAAQILLQNIEFAKEFYSEQSQGLTTPSEPSDISTAFIVNLAANLYAENYAQGVWGSPTEGLQQIQASYPELSDHIEAIFDRYHLNPDSRSANRDVKAAEATDAAQAQFNEEMGKISDPEEMASRLLDPQNQDFAMRFMGIAFPEGIENGVNLLLLGPGAINFQIALPQILSPGERLIERVRTIDLTDIDAADSEMDDLYRAAIDLGIRDKFMEVLNERGFDIDDQRWESNKGPGGGGWDSSIDLVELGPQEDTADDAGQEQDGQEQEQKPETEQEQEQEQKPETEQEQEQEQKPETEQEQPEKDGTSQEFDNANCDKDVHGTYTVQKGNVLSDFSPTMLHEQNGDQYMAMFDGMNRDERIKMSSAIVAKFNGLDNIHEIGIGTVMKIPTLEEAQRIMKENGPELQGHLREYGMHTNPGADFTKAGPVNAVDCPPLKTGV